jgi:hypothetical protein
VFWVHASNAARFEQSYRDIADRVKIAGRRDPQANIFKLVHDWLCDCRQRWLLVLDNVDDARFLLSDQADSHNQGKTTNAQLTRKPLREYVPYCERGSILIMTRNEEAALKLVERRRDVITVEPMDKPSAVVLLKKKLGILNESSKVAELAAALDYMPLAIVQAAAYISHRAPRCSVAKYLDEYRKSERKRTDLLNYDEENLRRDGQANNSIIVTWQISFEYIWQTRPSAADLLSLMSFFDRQGISETLIRSRMEHREIPTSQCEYDGIDSDSVEEDDTSQSSGSDDAFEADIRTLRNFCLLTVDNEGTSFQMHALVQLATHMWLAANGRLEQHRQQFVKILCASFPTGEYENWAICQTLFAHVKRCLERQPEGRPSLIQWATLLFNAAWYAWRKGSAIDAKKLAEKSVATRREELGKDHIDTLKSMTILAYSLILNRQLEFAERLHTEVLKRSKMKLGADHPVTLTSMGSLASIYTDQGRQMAAEELLGEVIRLRKTKQ